MEQTSLDFPALIRNKLTKWKILKYTSTNWCNEFKDKVLRFREGNKSYSETPCWEYSCSSREMKLSEFFELSSKETKNWLYFDYKYMKDVFKDNKHLMEDINWADLGLVGFTGEDSAFWIGNEGAHTPCHMDTYGCNFVAQIFGRKLWVLIPSDETNCLDPVRVPYEESSIYSSHNFYTPNDSLLSVKKAYKVILHPGDVLYIPRHWWHYVENLEVAISVNVWVPLEEDHESRLEESLVQHYVLKICDELSEEETKQILNPNEHNFKLSGCSMDLINKCVENCVKFRSENGNKKGLVKEIMKNLRNDLTQLDLTDMKKYVSDKRDVHNYSTSSTSVKSQRSRDDFNAKVWLAKKLINSYCHPANINLIKKSLLKEL